MLCQLFLACFQVNNGVVLPDKASLYLTAIEDAEYKEDKIECELIDSTTFTVINAYSLPLDDIFVFVGVCKYSWLRCYCGWLKICSF